MTTEEIMGTARAIALAFCVAYQDHRFSAKEFGDEVYVVFMGILKVVRIDEEVARKWVLDDDIHLGQCGAPT
ncbi:MAG: hypothetical protein BWY19_00706 [bacterium ADurb.Bin212]|nr:MAG: hypothetical protein BWY19_00706 [bacterium ADurb.Bin212]